MHEKNLARKWRSKGFDQIIGQDLSVGMLKNSLYLNYFFPVYLFSGKRGCGKTTTARIFGASVNCLKLKQFRQDAAELIPCLTCQSCLAMKEGNHPDFVEIDAASHTGVDNIRKIIEMASFLPVLGTKKIYLIDEAHMLSKAAFNALLKILEEPPESAFFILATTDLQKIIDTVRSRCFQVFFAAVSSDTLSDHLKSICKHEGIEADNDALVLIAKESEGCVRDALNLLERVRFSATKIDVSVVNRVLGHISDEHLCNLLIAIFKGDVSNLLQSLHAISSKTKNVAVEYIWRRLIELLSAMLWIKHGVEPTHLCIPQKMSTVANQVSFEKIYYILNMLYEHEHVLVKSMHGYVLLETLLMKLCHYFVNHDKDKNDKSGNNQSIVQQEKIATQKNSNTESNVNTAKREQLSDNVQQDSRWAQFVSLVQKEDDKLLTSIFTQGTFCSYDDQQSLVVVSFSDKFTFFSQWINDTRQQWLPMIEDVFGKKSDLRILFDKKSDQNQKNITIKKNAFAPQVAGASGSQEKRIEKTAFKKIAVRDESDATSSIDVSDASVWKIASKLLHYFPGIITAVEEQYGN